MRRCPRPRGQRPRIRSRRRSSRRSQDSRTNGNEAAAVHRTRPMLRVGPATAQPLARTTGAVRRRTAIVDAAPPTQSSLPFEGLIIMRQSAPPPRRSPLAGLGTLLRGLNSGVAEAGCATAKSATMEATADTTGAITAATAASIAGAITAATAACIAGAITAATVAATTGAVRARSSTTTRVQSLPEPRLVRLRLVSGGSSRRPQPRTREVLASRRRSRNNEALVGFSSRIAPASL